MGTSNGRGLLQNLVQWSQGEYAGANNHEDDLKIITNLKTNGFDFRADDFGNTKDVSTALAGTLVSVLSMSLKTVSLKRRRILTGSD